jgi:hypothetical protein
MLGSGFPDIAIPTEHPVRWGENNPNKTTTKNRIFFLFSFSELPVFGPLLLILSLRDQLVIKVQQCAECESWILSRLSCPTSGEFSSAQHANKGYSNQIPALDELFPTGVGMNRL